MTPHGTYTTVEDRPAVRFQRRLRHPVDAVWRMVTDPAELRHWFPCPVTIDELRVGGALKYDYGDDGSDEGEVLEVDPPRLFAVTWGVDLLRFELAAEGDGTLLTLVHVLNLEGAPAAAKVSAGWHLCLDAMEHALDGDPGEAPSGASEAWRRLYDGYIAAGVPSGAEVPGLS